MPACLSKANKAVVADLREVVTPSPDTTVSRTIYDSPDARIVLFALDAGQRLTDHSSAKPAIVQVLDGRIDFSVDGQTHTLETGGWVAMPANEVHAVRAIDPSRFSLTLLKGTV